MKLRTHLAATLVALATSPIWAQQPAASQAPGSASPQEMSTPQAASPAAEMTSVNAELVSKLDTRTAKTGDSVVVQTNTAIKTPEGTEIPKGSKLVGHIVAVQPSAAGQTSQMALLFDHIELSGGQSMPVHSQIRSITPAGGAASNDTPQSMSAPPANPGTPQPQGSAAAPPPAAETGPPPAGTVVAKTGNIDIRTTSVPGVLIANNMPGQQDPRMTHASSILLGAKRDVQLESGTQMVVGVSTGAAGQ